MSTSSTSFLPAAAPGTAKSKHQISSRINAEANRGADVWSMFNPTVWPPDKNINLGQGFMNWAPAEYIRKAADEAVSKGIDTHHYSHPKGRPRLRKALSEFYSPLFKEAIGDRKLDTETEILVTAGANEGMYAFKTAWLEEGDEVILFESYFDQYICNATFNGGVPVYVSLHPPKTRGNAEASEWTVEFDELERAITPKTKMILLNTPHNPIGKVFTRSELERIAELAIKHDLLVMSDEVYESLVYPPHEHVRIANLPGMWERTITVGSAGKSFAATGWRVGWLIGPKELVHPALVAQTRIVFTVNSIMQEATAVGFEQAAAQNFFPNQVQEYLARRDILLSALDELGLPYTIPHGSYFVLVDNRRIKIPEDYVVPEHVRSRPRDFTVSWFIAEKAGVVTIPPSEFYSTEHVEIGANYTRFSFCKDKETLREAGRRLQKLKPYLQ